eukprot:CAMPEP_0197518148 /NCGR_PEP_ID=MMETSP1318-20131121/3276_1 /TAXON_ID=552666 /ORGANISM="Partenskyella glossopodia, Strain RCC365" /LENGTH=102 /DNA_ID=CAMNT_0043068257 /DNA_START=520 /DNA_END=828 /DNA_ORIENTATION=-
MKNVIDKLFSGYGDMEAFGGNAPDQGTLQRRGKEYLTKDFPEIDYITSCTMSRSFRAKEVIAAAEAKLGRFYSVLIVLALSIAILAVLAVFARLLKLSPKDD